MVNVPLDAEKSPERLTDDFLTDLTAYELRLIILRARDRENERNLQISPLNEEMSTNIKMLTDNLEILAGKLDKNTNMNSDNHMKLTSYAEAVSVTEHSPCEEMRLILRQEEEKRLLAATEDRDKKREKNIIIYGLPEELDINQSKTKFLDISNTLNIEPKIEAATRLGRVGDNGRPRPLRICLESKYIKQKLIASAHKLKSFTAFHSIYLKPDLTFKERAEHKILWLALKQKITENPEIKWKIENSMVVSVGTKAT